MTAIKREGGNVRLRNELELAYYRQHGENKSYANIATDLYREFRTARLVSREILARYGVDVTDRTILNWLDDAPVATV